MSQRSGNDLMLCRVLGARVRATRKAQGLTLEQAGERVGMKLTHLSRLERGVYAPSYRNLMRLVEGLGMAPADLFAPVRPGECDDDEARNN